MAISVAIQTLTAAFSNGILLTAATSTLLVYFNSHGSTILQDGRRLVLALFLFFAALWAQVEFVNLMITSSKGCQVALVFSTAADQLARVALIQFLLWSSGNSSKVTIERLILQGILVARLVVGGILVGLTRPELTPVCVARTSITPVGIVVPSLDFLFMAILIIRALSKPSKDGTSSIVSSQEVKKRSNALVITGAGFLIWTGASVMMLLGMRGSLLILRTTLPSVGFIILVVLVAIFSGTLLPQDQKLTTPEATSPFINNGPSTREVFARNGPLSAANNYSRSGTLFPANPSDPTHDATGGFRSTYNTDGRDFKTAGAAVSEHPQEQSDSVNVPGYRGSSGIFPSGWATSITSEEAPAPVIRFTAEARSGKTNLRVPAQPKRSFFSWSSKPTAPTVRNLGISNPVMEGSQDLPEQPFARMQTIDLATAAANERVRREAALARSYLVTSRPAPHPPGLGTQEGLRKSISVKRKQISAQYPEPMPKIESSGSSGLSVEGINGASTSASLSPGRDEVRRRSPRSMNAFDADKALPKAFPENQIRGLPSNPRSMRMHMPKEQTVMLIKDIIYDNPATVNSIITGASDIYSQRLEGEEESSAMLHNTTLKSSASILHRPRPYRRESEMERSIYPSEPHPRHVRSKSGPSVSGKSIFGGHPGSPTQLPPLPAPPTMAAALTRLLPNNTKSMTFNEKIELLFPAPPGSVPSSRRRSSVPSIPRLPSIFLSETPHVQSPTDSNVPSRRASKRNTVASFDLRADTEPNNYSAKMSNYTLASFGLQESRIPATESRHDSTEAPLSQNRYRSRARSIADEVGETWIPGIVSNAVNGTGIQESIQQNIEHDIQRPYEPRTSTLTDTTYNQSSSPGSTIYWDSIQLGPPAIDFSIAKRNASSVQIRDIRKNEKSQALLPDVHEKVIVDMKPGLDNARQSFLLDENQTFGVEQTQITTMPTWHRRIGDELPTFSERKLNTRSRKMPPPTPLLLNSNGKAMAMVVHLAEPSPPIDYPEKAIAEIQAQLERFENPDRGSIGSLLRHIPDNSSMYEHGISQASTNRSKLLENLEMEMGLQQDYWQQMQTNLDRNSMSTTMSKSPSTMQELSLSQHSSPRSSRTISRRMSRRARVRSNMVRSIDEDTNSTTSTQSSDNSRASVWQQRLAEAQMEYLENAPALLSRKKSVNFLSVSKSLIGSLGSPTPPESLGSESDFTESESETEAEIQTQLKTPALLWQPALSSPKAGAGRLWTPPYEGPKSPTTPEPPASNLRASRRPMLSALPISTSSMWCKPACSAKGHSPIRLWQSKSAKAISIKQRPVTQRPLRKSKRMTFLPDIVESPKPLPFRNDTLGIFQFPWGETSDSAVMQPFIDPMSNARLEARSRQLELEEYSSSFFDDYDVENMDNESDDQGSDIESDDDFDETTLWEIASLLKTTDIPSKQSLLPAPREIVMEYDDSSESETDDFTVGESFNITDQPILPLTASPSKSVYVTEPQLWAGNPQTAMTVRSTGLPEPTSTAWGVYVDDSESVRRSKVHTATDLTTLDTNELWTIKDQPIVSKSATKSLWISPKPVVEAAPVHLELLTSAVFIDPRRPTSMWTQDSNITPVESAPVVSSSNIRTSFRTTKAKPAAQNMTKLPLLATYLWRPSSNANGITGSMSKQHDVARLPQVPQLWLSTELLETSILSGPSEQEAPEINSSATSLSSIVIDMVRTSRKTTSPLATLTSNELWNFSEKLEPEHHWISESSIRCESPSIYSEASSGESSPNSDTTSLKSTSTKASSFWGSITTKTWWDTKSPKKLRTPSPVETPILEQVSVSKQSESGRVLGAPASRDIREAMALPILSAIHTRKPIHRQHHRPMMPFRANWDEALAEAIAAGLTKLTRPVANANDWEDALSTAIAKGQSRLQRPVVSAADWSNALAEAMAVSAAPKSQNGGGMWEVRSNESHAASIISMWSTSEKRLSIFSSYNEQALAPPAKPVVPRSFDLQPLTSNSVWKQSNQTNSERDWILAGVPASTRQLTQLARTWAPILAAEKKLTTFTIASSSSPDMFTHIKSSPAKKAKANRPAALSRLNSTELFKPRSNNKQVTHWLHAISTSPLEIKSVIPKPQVWVAQDKFIEKEPLMFTLVPSFFPDMFAHITSPPVKNAATRQAPLPRLNSTELFKPRSNNKQVTHWLHTSSISRSTQATLTWTAPSNKLEPCASNMWSPNSTIAVIPSPLFSNPHTAPRNRTKREPSAMNEIGSWRLWRPDHSIPQSPTNWIRNANKHFSKVEFRY